MKWWWNIAAVDEEKGKQQRRVRRKSGVMKRICFLETDMGTVSVMWMRRKGKGYSESGIACWL